MVRTVSTFSTVKVLQCIFRAILPQFDFYRIVFTKAIANKVILVSKSLDDGNDTIKKFVLVVVMVAGRREISKNIIMTPAYVRTYLTIYAFTYEHRYLLVIISAYRRVHK